MQMAGADSATCVLKSVEISASRLDASNADNMVVGHSFDRRRNVDDATSQAVTRLYQDNLLSVAYHRPCLSRHHRRYLPVPAITAMDFDLHYLVALRVGLTPKAFSSPRSIVLLALMIVSHYFVVLTDARVQSSAMPDYPHLSPSGSSSSSPSLAAVLSDSHRSTESASPSRSGQMRTAGPSAAEEIAAAVPSGPMETVQDQLSGSEPLGALEVNGSPDRLHSGHHQPGYDNDSSKMRTVMWGVIVAVAVLIISAVSFVVLWSCWGGSGSKGAAMGEGESRELGTPSRTGCVDGASAGHVRPGCSPAPAIVRALSCSREESAFYSVIKQQQQQLDRSTEDEAPRGKKKPNEKGGDGDDDGVERDLRDGEEQFLEVVLEGSVGSNTQDEPRGGNPLRLFGGGSSTAALGQDSPAAPICVHIHQEPADGGNPAGRPIDGKWATDERERRHAPEEGVRERRVGNEEDSSWGASNATSDRQDRMTGVELRDGMMMTSTELKEQKITMSPSRDSLRGVLHCTTNRCPVWQESSCVWEEGQVVDEEREAAGSGAGGGRKIGVAGVNYQQQGERVMTKKTGGKLNGMALQQVDGGKTSDVALQVKSFSHQPPLSSGSGRSLAQVAQHSSATSAKGGTDMIRSGGGGDGTAAAAGAAMSLWTKDAKRMKEDLAKKDRGRSNTRMFVSQIESYSREIDAA
ncbi:hypothetical protein CBR_g15976 [Chara braunii]|uniref:Transmembrane protein n=1 Tax=Chara braunii TaxID=69332 RepID=A0A388JSU3_CHABU|nr:hypothetical protein CBR_g15976 [Chara braunii]|eukprot:GBG60855.1 hypothetical protein CBR_g15976 [Chara braunii]